MTRETDKNLIPNNERTPEEVRENARKGGIKSGEVRREKKRMKEMLEMLLEKELTNSNGEKATTLEAMMTACIKKALKGDIKANEFIRDTTGQKPQDKMQIEIDRPIIYDDVPKGEK